jgi:REP element-mobilizing transposase RayT
MLNTDSASARSAHRLYVHLLWPTLGRLPLIPQAVRGVVEGHLIALCRRLDAEPLCVRVLADRAHALVRFKPNHSVGRLVSHLKTGSEEALAAAGRPVRWGRGYAARTVGAGEVRRARRRIVSLRDRRLKRRRSRPVPARRTYVR